MPGVVICKPDSAAESDCADETVGDGWRSGSCCPFVRADKAAVTGLGALLELSGREAIVFMIVCRGTTSDLVLLRWRKRECGAVKAGDGARFIAEPALDCW